MNNEKAFSIVALRTKSYYGGIKLICMSNSITYFYNIQKSMMESA